MRSVRTNSNVPSAISASMWRVTLAARAGWGRRRARLLHVRKHHRADKVVLAEWKKKKKLCLYEWEQVDATWDPMSETWNPKGAAWKEVTAALIFGKQNSKAMLKSTPKNLSSSGPLTPGQRAARTRKANAKAAAKLSIKKPSSPAIQLSVKKVAATRRANAAAIH